MSELRSAGARGYCVFGVLPTTQGLARAAAGQHHGGRDSGCSRACTVHAELCIFIAAVGG